MGRDRVERGTALEILVDVGWGMVWAALLVAVVLFSSGASEFIYIDF
ncbi:MAG TPA: hypothetical protein VLA05_08410 [Coriobacteriia bacterium]|nr:hypothetical protein [Coriobacteriia bacterium]